MKKYLGIFFAAIFSCALGYAATQETGDATLQYKNQRGSSLEIKLHNVSDNSGTVTGTFKTAVADENCQNVIGEAHLVAGFYTGNSIAFSMNYPRCGAVVSVVGNFDKKKNIETLWIVANQAQDASGEDWNTKRIGHDSFKLLKSNK